MDKTINSYVASEHLDWGFMEFPSFIAFLERNPVGRCIIHYFPTKKVVYGSRYRSDRKDLLVGKTQFSVI